MEIHLNSRIVTYERVSKAVTLIAIIVEPIREYGALQFPLFNPAPLLCLRIAL